MSREGLMEALRTRVVVGDGAMGTMIYARGVPLGRCFDDLNRTNPHLIRRIHEEYVAAGAELVETNTFTANRVRLVRHGLEARVAEINRRAVEIARAAVGDRAWVAGSVGPLRTSLAEEPRPGSQRLDVFAEQIAALEGVDALILETFVDLEDLRCAIRAARATLVVPVIAQMTFTEHLRTPLGVPVDEAVRALEEEGVDVIGANCGVGPFHTRRVVAAIARRTSRPVSAFSNAGLPEYVDGRYIYLTTPDYFARTAQQMVRAGVNLVGGCCGTGPEHIRAVAERIKGARPVPRRLAPAPAAEPVPRAAVAAPPRAATVSWFERMRAGEKVLVVEIDPPRGLGHEKLVEKCVRLRRMGVDATTVGDNPLAVMRMGAVGFAHLVEREGVEVILHLSCRDRNLIGMQSVLLEAWALGIRSILAVTGDPARVGDQPGATSVYDMNSFELIRLIAAMNRGRNHAGQPIRRATGFRIGGAFNPNVRELAAQIRRLSRKIEAGAEFALPQPLYDAALVRPMYRALREAVGDFPVLFGLCPFVSAHNAEFLAHEVPGIRVPEVVLERIRGVPEGRQREEGLAIMRELIEAAWDDAPGFYLIPPFGSVEIVAACLEHMRRLAVARGVTRG